MMEELAFTSGWSNLKHLVADNSYPLSTELYAFANYLWKLDTTIPANDP